MHNMPVMEESLRRSEECDASEPDGFFLRDGEDATHVFLWNVQCAQVMMHGSHAGSPAEIVLQNIYKRGKIFHRIGIDRNAADVVDHSNRCIVDVKIFAQCFRQHFIFLFQFVDR